ncbi:MAG: hypothetical protein M1370_00315 [Bacteroidetes bacterium]|nr:hypothetical protein [Bacteroidota bacterium]
MGTVFGWVFFSHQVGAASAAYLGGLARATVGDYTMAFLMGGALALMAGMLALRIKEVRIKEVGSSQHH